ncbi:MAG: transposase [Cyclobacteriaceae bacterium]|nr:transposase [Cyclobacteriaceae bacterium]
MKTIAGRVVRELERNVTNSKYDKELLIFKSVLSQTKTSKNKIYSLHEPEVYCIAKGKVHKKYEYGCKASIVLTQNTGIIVGAMTFTDNIYDGKTLDSVLGQTKELTGKYPKTATVDRGYQGMKMVKETQIIRPSKPLKRDNTYQRMKKRLHCRRRAAIEPIIGHLKSDHLVARNYLKGQIGDSINFILAASTFNYKKLMKKLKKEILWLQSQINHHLEFYLNIIVSQKRILSFNPKDAF